MAMSRLRRTIMLKIMQRMKTIQSAFLYSAKFSSNPPNAVKKDN